MFGEKIFIPVFGGMISFALILTGGEAWGARKAEPASCAACHAELKSVLPQGHGPVSGKDIKACLSCHPPSAQTGPNPFSARLHRAHLKADAKTECTLCHSWAPGKNFGLQSQRVSWGAPSKASMDLIRRSAASWCDSPFLDARHGRENLICSACHGQNLPSAGDEVENDICLGCHGPEEKLAAKTIQSESPKFNPHKSHLFGLACTKCHAGHQESKVYCQECHKDLKMKMPGGPAGK
jgi:hypothetical protein